LGKSNRTLSAALSLVDSQALVDEEKLDEALPYLARAVEAEPSYWGAHAIYADLYLRQGSQMKP